MNYVDEKPIDELELRLGLREMPGTSEITLQTGGRPITLRYTNAGEKHRVHAAGNDIPVRLWDKLASPVELKREN